MALNFFAHPYFLNFYAYFKSFNNTISMYAFTYYVRRFAFRVLINKNDDFF
jgi:hypothetical protein